MVAKIIGFYFFLNKRNEQYKLSRENNIAMY
jgi:hypothetical protein